MSTPAEELERKRLRDLASTFKPDKGMERLARLRDNHPDQYERFSVGLRMRLAHYLHAKAALEQLQKLGG